jgi:hypothetical protein
MNKSNLPSRPRPTSLWLATLTLASAGAAAALGCGSPPDGQDDRGDVVRSSAALTRVPPCPTRDAVAFQTVPGDGSGSCTKAPGGWTVTELVREAGATPGLYCWYRATNNVDRVDFSVLPSTAEPDCPLLSPQPLLPQATSLTRLPADQLTATMAGAVSPMLPALGDTNVAILDNTPNQYDSGNPDHYLHGRAVARTIARLACVDPTSPACLGRIKNRLVMSYGNDLPSTGIWNDDVNGGYFGTRAELANQLRIALDDLQAAPAGRRLVINLSLGWDPEADGTYPADASRKAVESLLNRAACLGALTVVAAGNGESGGAMLPAAWQKTAAPDQPRCSALGFPVRRPFGTGGSPERPLVYAVGAVDATDRPLAVSRPRSLPRLVAYGMAVDSGLSFPGSAAPPPLTGTSMATAIATAAAVAVWDQLPDADPHDVMSIVYQNGMNVPGLSGPALDGRAVELCIDSSPCTSAAMHRVSLCGAITAAVKQANANRARGVPATLVPNCSTSPSHAVLDGPPSASQILIGWSTGVPYAPGPPPDVGAHSGLLPCRFSVCRPPGSKITSLPLGPWTWPEPIVISCPACRVTQGNPWDNYLWGRVDPVLSNPTWSGQLVVTALSNGAPVSEQIIPLSGPQVPTDISRWLPLGALTSAMVRLELASPGSTEVSVSQPTAIQVDPF